MKQSFDEHFAEIFDRQFHSVFRYIDRLSGDPDLAADVAQDTFVRLYRRGMLPDAPEGWLISVAMNLFRNARSKRNRRIRLLTEDRAERVMADPSSPGGECFTSAQQRIAARTALDRVEERDRDLLLLRAEGYSYRDIAATLNLKEASVGTMLARAKTAFRRAYEETADAP